MSGPEAVFAALLVILGAGTLVCLAGWWWSGRGGPSTGEREAVQGAEPYLCLRHTADCGHDAQMEFADEVAMSMAAGFFWHPPGGGVGKYDDLGAGGEARKQEISLLSALWLAGDVPVVPGRMPGEGR